MIVVSASVLPVARAVASSLPQVEVAAVEAAVEAEAEVVEVARLEEADEEKAVVEASMDAAAEPTRRRSRSVRLQTSGLSECGQSSLRDEALPL